MGFSQRTNLVFFSAAAFRAASFISPRTILMENIPYSADHFHVLFLLAAVPLIWRHLQATIFHNIIPGECYVAFLERRQGRFYIVLGKPVILGLTHGVIIIQEAVRILA